MLALTSVLRPACVTEQSPAASQAGPAVHEQTPATSVGSFAGVQHSSMQASPADSTVGNAASGRSEGPQQAAVSTQQAALAASDDSNEDCHSEADADEQQDDQVICGNGHAGMSSMHRSLGCHLSSQKWPSFSSHIHLSPWHSNCLSAGSAGSNNGATARSPCSRGSCSISGEPQPSKLKTT